MIGRSAILSCAIYLSTLGHQDERERNGRGLLFLPGAPTFPASGGRRSPCLTLARGSCSSSSCFSGSSRLYWPGDSRLKYADGRRGHASRRPSPLHLDSLNGERRSPLPGKGTARARSYTSMASLENDREEDLERDRRGSDRIGGDMASGFSTDAAPLASSPTDTTLSAETAKMGSLSLQQESRDPQQSIGDNTPRRLAPASVPRRKSSATSTSTITRSRTLPRGRRSSNNASGTDSHDDEGPATPTRPRRASMKRGSSSFSMDPMESDDLPGPSDTRRQSFRQPSQFVAPDVAARMKRWVEEIVVCNFDLDRGPIVERRMLGRPWAKGEKANM